MRICRISSASPFSHDGMAHHILHLSREQARGGHDVTLLQPHPVASWKEDFEICKVPIWPYQQYTGRKAEYIEFCLSAALMIVRMHMQHSFDLIHAHGDFLDALSFGLLGRIFDLPLVLTIHAGLNRRRLYTVFAGVSFQFTDRFIAVSPEIAADLSERLGQDSSRIYCISSGIRWEAFSPLDSRERNQVRLDLKIPPEATVVLQVGTLSEMKGQRYSIQAVDILKNRSDLLFILVGGVQDETVSELVASAGANVRYVGLQSPDEVKRYLLSADIFILPSVYLRGKREGTPTALMEAMAAELPVVVTDSGGVLSLVQDGLNGYVVPQRNANALADRIAWLADSPSLRQSMGKRNRVKVKDKDWNVISCAVESIYRSIGSLAIP